MFPRNPGQMPDSGVKFNRLWLWVFFGLIPQTCSFIVSLTKRNIVSKSQIKNLSTTRASNYYSQVYGKTTRVKCTLIHRYSIQTLRETDSSLEISASLDTKMGVVVDSILKDLVSPAPESFLVIDRALSNLGDADGNLRDVLLDLEALSRYLVKPNCGIEIYEDFLGNAWRWRTLPIQSDKHATVSYKLLEDDSFSNFSIESSSSRLHHELTSLELAKLSIDVATGAAETGEIVMMDIVEALEVS